MKTVIHKSHTRGYADHGWLKSYHTFSFANYFNPERIHFGVLRVLNDDIVEPGKGFGMHPHDNMEIISIPLYGELEHKDSMGNVQVIKQNDIQIMSAGTGIFHSEYNKNIDKPVNFLQIWIFPNIKNTPPAYQQKTFWPHERTNKLQTVIAPNQYEALQIKQDAWFLMGNFDKAYKAIYTVKKTGNGIYIFVIKGNITISGHNLNERDGMGIWQTDIINIYANEYSEILIMDIPMKVS